MSEEEPKELVFNVTLSQLLEMIQQYYSQGLKDKEDACTVAFRDGYDRGFVTGQEYKEKLNKTHEMG